MRATTLLLAAAVLGLIGGAIVVGDALITTDEERLERFVDTVTGTVDASTLEAGLSWTDPAVQPLEVEARGMGKLYDGRNADELQVDARRALRGYMGDTLRPLRSSIEVDANRATIRLRLLTNRGMVDARFHFRKRSGPPGERWLLDKAWVR